MPFLPKDNDLQFFLVLIGVCVILILVFSKINFYKKTPKK